MNFEKLQTILNSKIISFQDICTLLQLSEKSDITQLQSHAYAIKKDSIGTKAYLRGLIEYSNICSKNCLYCGIRASNSEINRYTITNQEILDAVDFAWKNNYGSIAIQSGEIQSPKFTQDIYDLIVEIKKRTNNQLGITLSLGEQTEEVYKTWFDAGAHRYLLRIETSNKDLYQSIHPQNSQHSFETRIDCLRTLQKIGYQVGTGVMVGLPNQTIEDLANDILFLQQINVAMVGLGPYIEHSQTPLFEHSNNLLTQQERFQLTLNMIAVLRIVMKDINIVSATALQSIHLMGREKGLQFGANILMPNITPSKYRKEYLLYENKPCIEDTAEECKGCLDKRVSLIGETIGYSEWGDSKHFVQSIQKK